MGSGQPLDVAAHSRKSSFEIGETRELGFQLVHPPEGLFQCLRQLDLLGSHLLRPGLGHLDPECHVSQPSAALLDFPDLVLQPSNLLLQFPGRSQQLGRFLMGSGQPLDVAAHYRKSSLEIREPGCQLFRPPVGLFQCLRQLDLLGRHFLRPGLGHLDPECRVSQPNAAFLDFPDLVLQPSNLLLQLCHHPRRAGQLRYIVPRIGHLRHDLAQARQTPLEIVGALQRGRQRTRGLIVGPRQIFRPFLQGFNARKHLADRGIVLEIGELPADILDGRPGLFDGRPGLLEWYRDFLHTLRRGCRFFHQRAERLFLALSPLDELAEFFG